MLKRCVPFRTRHSRRRQRQMTEPSTSHEAHTPSPHPNSPLPSKIIIGGKSISMFNYIMTNFMVHLCLKMEQVGLNDCRITISAGDFLMSLRVAWRLSHILCVSPGAAWLSWISVPFHHCCLEMHFLVCFLFNKLLWWQKQCFHC